MEFQRNNRIFPADIRSREMRCIWWYSIIKVNFIQYLCPLLCNLLCYVWKTISFVLLLSLRFSLGRELPSQFVLLLLHGHWSLCTTVLPFVDRIYIYIYLCIFLLNISKTKIRVSDLNHRYRKYFNWEGFMVKLWTTCAQKWYLKN